VSRFSYQQSPTTVVIESTLPSVLRGTAPPSLFEPPEMVARTGSSDVLLTTPQETVGIAFSVACEAGLNAELKVPVAPGMAGTPGMAALTITVL